MDKNKMLIDATHPEETRVVAVRNGRVEDFDFESAARKLLRGNIYLAKVTRVEPSLQAAFIDYGGNRHGFLAFNEIHPDYYQIPVADREALKREEAEAELRAEAEADERVHSRGGGRRRRRGRSERQPSESRAPQAESHLSQPHEADDAIVAAPHDDATLPYPDVVAPETPDTGASASALRHDGSPEDVLTAEPGEHRNGETADPSHPLEAAGAAEVPAPSHPHSDREAEHVSAAEPMRAPVEDDADEAEADDDEPLEARDVDLDDDLDGDDEASESTGGAAIDADQVEQVASEDDALEELPERPRRRARQYKIQEVIKRRQIMLVQVVKEERGNKGAALTTYISLAGRYTVLMPNTARGGGISRKITQPQDRKRLKAIAEELDVPEGMGLIIRTAGAARTKQEIKRDYEYLLRLWERVRDVTLSSTAPCLVYEEGNIIKRAIRDLYSKDFDRIVVAGDAAHREAQDFMEMLMPGSGGHVASFRDPEPLFARYGVERQLNALFSPYVTLRSGGYIVINQTEALVSVDVNSGKSTREFSIEETALNTNLEAAEEIARQLKLRDLAGLIVVDFIDMEEKRNNRSVERRLKDALRHDRARIQVGRISHFGLLEMSRQRLRAGVLEGSTSQCPHCQGTGIIRSIESVALAVLRALEDHLLKQPTSLSASTTAEVALYILNHKRAFIVDMERRHGVAIRVEASDRMQGANFAIERFAAPVVQARTPRPAVSMEWGFDRDTEVEEAEVEEVEAVAEAPAEDGPRAADDERRGRSRRRRRGRRDREAGAPGAAEAEVASPYDEEREAGEAAEVETLNGDDGGADDTVARDVAAESDSEADGGEADGAEANGSGENGERRRRGRRRGRRGGRARRREGGAEAGASLDDVDRQEWSISEVARPGAEQPSTEVASFGYGASLGLVSSSSSEALAETHRSPPHGAIVETLGSDAGRPDATGRSPEFDAANEAVRLATLLASPTESPSAASIDAAPMEAAPMEAGKDEAPVLAELDMPTAELPVVGDASPVAEAMPAPTAPIAAEAMSPAAAPEQPVADAEVAKATDVETTAPEVSASEVTASADHAAAEAREPAPATNGSAASAPEAASAAEWAVTHTRETAETIGITPRPTEPDVVSSEEANRPSRRGWWQRRFGSP